MKPPDTITEKVKTPFGNLYAHVTFANGVPTDIAISTPGRFLDTSVSHAFEATGEAITKILHDVYNVRDPGDPPLIERVK